MGSGAMRQRWEERWRSLFRGREPAKRNVEKTRGAAAGDSRPLLTLEEIFSVPAGDDRMPLQYHRDLVQPWSTNIEDKSRLERTESGFRYIIPDRGVTGVIEAIPDEEAKVWRLTLWLLPQVVGSEDADDAFLALAVLCVSEPPCASTALPEPVGVMHQIVFDSLEVARQQDVRWVLSAMELWAKNVREGKPSPERSEEE